MAAEKIVLLHGMGRTRASMLRPARWFARAGWSTRCIGYPSLRQPIERLAQHVARELESETDTRLHFVTHSLGGLVLRRLLHTQRPANLGRVAMLAPPNRGSRLARRFPSALRLVPALRQMALPDAELDRLFGNVDYDLLVIAGSRPAGPLRWFSSATHDGVVAVEETHEAGCSATLVVQRSHTFLMNSVEALQQIDQFFRCGAASIENAQTAGSVGGNASGRSNSNRIVVPSTR